ncbi:hypothetical protein [Rhizobium sp. 2MFCol3.1]|uniref:hypothetical protein n=1 Tax=Rhizobium sp. 2MFCol3.1 TaxID=1246459 RepID=UPI0012DDA165|nr:hypothetical protein [Rhizobium sp. 2MFCol3.1]
MINQRYAVTSTASVEAATPQEAAEKMLDQLGKARSVRFDVVDESGSTFHVTVHSSERSHSQIQTPDGNAG